MRRIRDSRHGMRICGDIVMQRFYFLLLAATLVGLSLAGGTVHAAPLTRALVRDDLIAAELTGAYPPNKANKPDPATLFTAKRAAKKVARQYELEIAQHRNAAGVPASAPPQLPVPVRGGE
jgi:hypothetical protein